MKFKNLLCLIFVLALSGNSLIVCENSFGAGKPFTSVNDLKKKAEKLFNEEKYGEAIESYSQLLSLEPQSPAYNYCYGVCILFAGRDKSQAISYLETAAKSSTTKPEVHFYLGRSYMYASKYNQAIVKFEEYKKAGSGSMVAKLKVDQLIGNCKTAIELNKNRRNVTITGQKQVSRSSFYASYDFTEASGKMLTATDNFLTEKDKEKMNSSVMFMTKDGQTVYFASYGKKGDKGKEIYKAIRITGDKWSDPINLGDKINSSENEDFPYPDKDGKTLYFCSKGHNSMGGYDIFKSVYDFSRNEWSEPVNIGIPINTTDDDIFYVPNLKGDQATYATAIESETGRIDIRNIRLGDVMADVAIVKGVYISQDQLMRRDARLTVVNSSNNEVITSVRTNPATGEYELVLPPNKDYMLVVEGGSYLPHAESFTLPRLTPGLSLKQKVMMNKSSTTEKMTVSNFFTAPLANAKTENETPSEVKSSELNVSAIDTSKMTPISIEGKTIYVSQPSSTANAKEIVASSENKKAVQNEKVSVKDATQEIISEVKSTSAITTDKADKSQPVKESIAEANKTAPVDNTEVAKTPSDKVVSEQNSTSTSPAVEAANNAVKQPENLNKPEQQAEETASTTGSKQENKEEESLNVVQPETPLEDMTISKPVVTAKTSNAELVKMCFTEAYALRTEANMATEKAKEKRQEQAVLDSLSKSQAKQAVQLISSNKELSKQLFSESKENSMLADAKMNEALALETEAVEKNRQATEEIKEATQLMIDLKVDTNATTYATLSKSKSDKKTKSQPVKETATASSLPSNAAEKQNEQPVAMMSKTEKSSHPIEENKSINPQPSSTSKSEPANVSSTESKSVNPGSQQTEEALKQPVENKKQDVQNENISAQAEKAQKSVAETQSMPASTPDIKQSLASPSSISPVSSEPAMQHYQSYTEKTKQKNAVEKENEEINQKILTTSNKQERDSLISRSNELNRQSIQQWQEAQKELAKAKEIDPEIENKMKPAEQAVAQSSNESSQGNVEKKTQPDAALLSASNTSSTKDASTSATQPQPETSSSKSSETSAPSLATNVGTSKTPSSSPATTSSANIAIDTTRAEYPRYKEIIQQIDEKQKETVDIFVEGMQINKKAIVAKEDEIRLREQAKAETSSKKKAELLEQADLVKLKGDSLIKLSSEKLATAQKNTRAVKEMTAESNELKSKMTSPRSTPADKPVQTASLPTVQANSANNTALNTETNNTQPKAETTSLKTKVNNEKISSYDKMNMELAAKQPAEKKDVAINVPVSKEVKKTEPVVVKSEPANINTSESKAAEKPVNDSPIASAVPSKVDVKSTSSGNEAEAILPSTYSPNEVETFTYSPKQADNTGYKIPMDPSLPEGLVFKVQIGAFKAPLADNTFGTLQPLSGETSRPGWIRYCLGLFRSFEPANLLKKQVRTIGYRDAYVVAYLNGKRIELYEAYLAMSKSSTKEKKMYADISDKEFKHLAKFDIRASQFATKPDEDTKSFYGTTEYSKESAASSQEQTTASGSQLIEYSVQVGAYKTSRIPSALTSLLPLNSEKNQIGLYRLTTGRFANYLSADSMKKVAVTSGVKDAFIIVYRGGSKVQGKEAINLLKKGKTAPLINKVSSPSTAETTSLTSLTTFKKASEPSGITFKIQLGAYKENVSDSLLIFRDKEVTQETDSRGYRIFYVGNYKSYNDAVAAKDDIMSKGVKDAFVTAFDKSKQISVNEALDALSTK